MMSEMVYKGFRQEEMEFHFNPTAAVPEYARWAEETGDAQSLLSRAILAQMGL